MKREAADAPRANEPGGGLAPRDVQPLLDSILKMAVEMLNADRGLILQTTSEGGLECVARHNFPEDGGDVMAQVSASTIRNVLTSGAPQLLHTAADDPRLSQTESRIIHHITSTICVPITLDDRVAGVIYVDSRRNRQRFTNENLNFVEVFGRMAGIALEYAAGYQQKVRELQSIYSFHEIVGKSKKMQEIFILMRRVMDSDIAVLLEGESGTGKELVARALHYSSRRAGKPFVAQFCGNLAESLLESELFGHKKGAFTGAVADKKGLFEIADGGTFFLDEIADISPTIQAKLLRVLQEGEIRRVGDTEARKVNVRIISATNKSLKAEVDAGKFREDLYYRLNVITIRLPPLRERTGDIPLLAKHFLEQFARKNKVPVKRLTPRALQALSAYQWPGNVRELENTIERACILAEGEYIDVGDLYLQEAPPVPETRTLREWEREIVRRTLEECGGNRTRTAEVLGVSLRWLQYKLKEWERSGA